MNIVYFPDESTVAAAIRHDDPLLLLVSHDGTKLIVANIDDGLDHSVLLQHTGRPPNEVDQYFRVTVNHRGADWTCICPEEYGGHPDYEVRMQHFRSDGQRAIRGALDTIGYAVPIEVPARFRRHETRVAHQ